MTELLYFIYQLKQISTTECRWAKLHNTVCHMRSFLHTLWKIIIYCLWIYICMYIYTWQIRGSPCFWGGKEVNGTGDESKRQFNFIATFYFFPKKKKLNQIGQKLSIYLFLEFSTLMFILCGSFVFFPQLRDQRPLALLSERVNPSIPVFPYWRCTESNRRALKLG